jgi:hypothetical protein
MHQGAARPVLAAVIAVALAGCDSTPARPTAIPSFTTPHTHSPNPARRTTLLPTDCTQVLPASSVAALLAQPVDAFSAHTVLGVGSPSVGLLERLDCSYRRRGDTTTATLVLRAQAYTDPSAASRHMEINVAAEGVDAHTIENTAIGAAPATLLPEPGRRVIMVTYGRVNLTISLPEAVVPTLATSDVLVDLAQRVLPTLAPQPPDPTSTAPSSSGSPTVPLDATVRLRTPTG